MKSFLCQSWTDLDAACCSGLGGAKDLFRSPIPFPDGLDEFIVRQVMDRPVPHQWGIDLFELQTKWWDPETGAGKLEEELEGIRGIQVEDFVRAIRDSQA